MSFNWHAAKVRDESLPMAYRASHLRSCALRLGWLIRKPREAILKPLLQHFPVHDNLNEEQLIAALSIIERNRERFLERLGEFESRRKEDKCRGKRTPSDDEVAALYDFNIHT